MIFFNVGGYTFDAIYNDNKISGNIPLIISGYIVDATYSDNINILNNIV